VRLAVRVAAGEALDGDPLAPAGISTSLDYEVPVPNMILIALSQIAPGRAICRLHATVPQPQACPPAEELPDERCHRCATGDDGQDRQVPLGHLRAAVLRHHDQL